MEAKRNGKVMFEYTNDVDTDTLILNENWWVPVENFEMFVYEIKQLFDKYDVTRVCSDKETF